jgi:hypothetical protein
MTKKAPVIASAAIAGLLFAAPAVRAQDDGSVYDRQRPITQAWDYDRYGYDNRNPRDDWFFDYYDYGDRGRGDPDMELGGDDPFGMQEPYGLSGRGEGDRDFELGGDDPFGWSARGSGDRDREFGGDDRFGFDSQLGAYDDVGDAGWADV